MVRPAVTSPFALVLATTAVLSAACFDTSSTITTADYPTVLTVDPLLFRGSLTCGAPGLARYVVTLTDVSVTPTIPLTSSIPVACQNHVSFGDSLIIGLHYYTATIDGYDRDDVTPAALGSRDMLDPSSGELVPPTWITTCGELPPHAPAPDAEAEPDAADDGKPPYNPLRYPTQVLNKAEVILHGCVPLVATRTRDASVDDGSSGGGDADAGPEAESPVDASLEASDVGEPDGSGPDDEGGDDGGVDG